MGKYVMRRLLLMGPAILILSLFVFLIMRVIPGDVAQSILAGEDVGATRVQVRMSLEVLRERLGLNRPLYVQYLTWLWDTIRGDFGDSLVTGKPVAQELAVRLPMTIQLALMSKILAIILGVPIGILCAVRQNTWTDFTLRFWTIFFDAAPSFWIALLAIFVGAFWFNWLPPLGYNPISQDPGANMVQLLIPTLILGVGGMAGFARMSRSTMLEVLREDYIRTARSKGLKEQVVIIRHALKNALIPVVTLAGLSFAALLGGTVILEAIFGIPGMGQYLINGIQTHDFIVVQAVVMLFGVVVMVVNLVIDLLYGWLDPRISYS